MMRRSPAAFPPHRQADRHPAATGQPLGRCGPWLGMRGPPDRGGALEGLSWQGAGEHQRDAQGSPHCGGAMTTETQTEVAARLDISVLALWSLSGNASFPPPVGSNDQDILWDSADIAAFQALWSAVRERGWRVSNAQLPSANFTMMSSTTPGQARRVSRIETVADFGRQLHQPG
jgi:hypothetical protein